MSAAEYFRQSAEAYAREGMYDNAIACCKKIRRYAPDEEDTSLMIGRYYAAKGLIADAAVELEAYADRMDREGRKKEAMDALAELVQLAPGRPLQRERLAKLHSEHGQRDAALEEYRAARSEYHKRGDQEGAARAAERIAEQERDQPRKAEPTPPPSQKAGSPPGPRDAPPAAEPPPARETSARDAPEERAPIPLDLEIEHTSYTARPSGAESTAAPEKPAEALDPELALPLEDPGSGPAEPSEAEAGSSDPAEAAERLREARRWEEAVDAYRRLAESGRAGDEDLAAWTESARQAGMASLVLEALAFQARWHLEAGRRSSARQAAEEMLLVDPRNEVASEILSKVGSTLPRD